ncbi:helicase-related protein [Haloimpatiens sp. FM7330]|uniref:helicase-related protein n=1 Tax=Haloimpatiens sp. FM7330 TaxID=3298610 RepID=UPI003629A216
MRKNKSGILDNRKRGTVGEYLKENIDDNSKLSIISAYFTIYAYNVLKEKLDNIEELRFLFGEPTFIKNEKLNKSREFKITKSDNFIRDRINREDCIADHNYNIELKEKLQQSAIAKECRNWIQNKVSIKSMIKPNFLHGKLYHIEKLNGIEKSVMGSSNFTVNGLGLGKEKNIELNLITDSNRDIEDLKEWFNELWENEEMVIDVKEEVLNFINQLYKENSPQYIYYVTIYNIFKDFLLEQNEEEVFQEKVGFKETMIWQKLYDFQKDGVRGAINRLEKYNGCILADSVGLGKTFEALAVIKYYEIRNKKVLVLTPKKLRENWTIYTLKDTRNILLEDNFRYTVMNHTDLTRTSGKSGNNNIATFMWNIYDLVVIDESHNFRNGSKGKNIESRYSKLINDVVKSGTKVLMLSATPVNNSLKDLKNQIYIATRGKNDAFYEKMGIRNVQVTLKIAQEEFNKWYKNNKKDRAQLMSNINKDFIKLLDEFTIARSRKHIQKYYKESKKINFPKRLNPKSICVNVDKENEFLGYDRIYDIMGNLNLSIFHPSHYIKKEKQVKYKQIYDTKLNKGISFTQEDREFNLIAMMRVIYMKRLESSINSFRISIEKLITKIKKMIDKINLIEEKEEYIDFDLNNLSDLKDEELEEFLVGGKIKILLQDMELDAWKTSLIIDKEKLEGLIKSVIPINYDRDSKLIALKNAIEEKVKTPINKGNKKIIIFTAYADTAEYIYEGISDWIKKKFNLNTALVTGNGTNKSNFSVKGYKYCNQLTYESILTNFSPYSKERSKMNNMPQDGQVDILVATDCISEGQNLQDCDYVINYDIHWNPVRIIQRVGRIDRLNSMNSKIGILNFWPTEDLNKYIKVLEKVKSRMILMDISSTGEEDLLDINMKDEMNDLEYRAKQLARLKNEVVDLEDLDDNITLTEFNLIDFRMDLLSYINEKKETLERAPLGMYSIVPSQWKTENSLDKKYENIIKPGIIYCLKRRYMNEKTQKYNIIEPYYLTYVYEDGTIKFGYAQLKQILDIYRGLCIGKDKPYSKLCDIFNKETNECRNMNKQLRLLEKCVKNIIGYNEKQNILAMTKRRGAKLLNNKEKLSGLKDFEIISFLVIK